MVSLGWLKCCFTYSSILIKYLFACLEKALLRHSNLLALGKPSESDVTSLSNWMNGKNPTAEEESHFLDLRADLSPLSSQADQSNFLEAFLGRHCYKLFVTKVSNYRKSLSKDLTTI